MAADMVGLANTQYFVWAQAPAAGQIQLNQTRAVATAQSANALSTMGASQLNVIIQNGSVGAVPVILIVEWLPDDQGGSGSNGDESVIEQGVLAGGVRRSTVLPTEFGPISNSRPGVGCVVELPCAGHFVNVLLYTDAAPAGGQLVNVALEFSVTGADRNSVV